MCQVPRLQKSLRRLRTFLAGYMINNFRGLACIEMEGEKEKQRTARESNFPASRIFIMEHSHLASSEELSETLAFVLLP